MNEIAKNEDGGESQGQGMLVASGGVGLSAMARAEIDMQITTARAFPRSPKRVRNALLELVTLDDAAAEEATYALPRGGKPITGPSIRFAESVKQSWGNCRASTEVTEINKDLGYVEAVGVFHDLETNVVTRIPHRRRITTSKGKIFADDMILVTANAASSIAMRECILKGVPKPVWRAAYESVMQVISGDIETLAVNRDKAVKAFARFGVKPEQVFMALGVAGEEDIVLDHIAVLRGMFSALKNGEETVETMFAKRGEKEVDKNYSPLAAAAGKQPTTDHDSVTGEVTENSTSKGGEPNEVKDSTDKGDHRAEGTSSTENRSATEQQVSQAGEAPATESKVKASDTPAPSDASGASEAGNGSSSQPDLLANTGGASPPDGAGKSDKPPIAERLASYARALGTINDGGPPKLIKQAQAWTKKYGEFEGDGKKKSDAIYNLHLQRLNGEIKDDAVKTKVVEIIGQ